MVCVYAEALIPNRNGLKQPYTWENAFHMTVSDAVEKSLFAKERRQDNDWEEDLCGRKRSAGRLLLASKGNEQKFRTGNRI